MDEESDHEEVDIVAGAWKVRWYLRLLMAIANISNLPVVPAR